MPMHISTTNKGIFNALEVSKMVLPVYTNSKTNKITLKYMLYVPDLAFTLISIEKCDNVSYKTTFVGYKCIIKGKTGTVLIQAPKYHGLYQVDHQPAEFTMSKYMFITH
jgi:hypothetical protein